VWFATFEAVQAGLDVLARQFGSTVMGAGVGLDLADEFVFVVGSDHLAAVLARHVELQCDVLGCSMASVETSACARALLPRLDGVAVEDGTQSNGGCGCGVAHERERARDERRNGGRELGVGCSYCEREARGARQVLRGVGRKQVFDQE
jgi:hypothetical protein